MPDTVVSTGFPCRKAPLGCAIESLYSPRDVPVAQLVEQRIFNPWVEGSIPSGRTI